jgi:hypothetical protein
MKRIINENKFAGTLFLTGIKFQSKRHSTTESNEEGV